MVPHEKDREWNRVKENEETTEREKKGWEDMKAEGREGGREEKESFSEGLLWMGLYRGQFKKKYLSLSLP